MRDTVIDVEVAALQRNANGARFAFFTGLIDEVRIFDRALSAREVGALAARAE